jgi:hypothetical protein
MGLMLFPHPLKTLTSMQRMVKQEGRVAVMVHSAATKNPYHGLPLEIVRRIGSMAPPPPEQPGMFALGGSGVLEGTFRTSGLRDVSVRPVSIRRKYSSLAEAIKSMKESHAVLRNLLAKLNDADQGRAWKEIEQEMSQFAESANGFEAPGEVLIGSRNEVSGDFGGRNRPLIKIITLYEPDPAHWIDFKIRRAS